MSGFLIYRTPMADLDNETKHSLEVIKAFDKAIEEGPWDESSFFRAIGNKLIQIRDQYKRDLHLESTDDSGMPTSIANRIAQRHGLAEVFIVLYNSEGSNQGKWESMLQNVQSYAVNRPVYEDEAFAKAALRGAMNKQNEAYIAAYVQKESILELPEEKTPYDRWGNKLLALNNNAISLSNVTRLIHISGKYEVENGKMHHQGVVDFL